MTWPPDSRILIVREISLGFRRGHTDLYHLMKSGKYRILESDDSVNQEG